MYQTQNHWMHIRGLNWRNPLAQTWTELAGSGFSWNCDSRNGPKIEPLLTLCELNTYHSTLEATDVVTAEFHQHTGNHYLILGFVLAHIPCNSISQHVLHHSYNVIRCELALSCARTISNICCTKYSLAVDAIKKQLPARNKVSIALAAWTSMNTLGIILVIAYNMEHN